MNLRALSGLVGIVATAAACAATSFSTVGDDASTDTGAPPSDASKHVEAAREAGRPEETGIPRKDAASKDAGAKDAGGRDSAKEAANETHDAVTPTDATADVTSPADGSVADGAGEDVHALTDASDAPVSHDAGPPCLTKKAEEGAGIFLVNATTPATGACGSRANPCTDLASALAALTATKTTVYVGDGTYSPLAGSSSFPQLPEGVTLLGGWQVTTSASAGYVFTATCTPNATLSSAASAVLTIGSAATPSSSIVTLDTLSVETTGTPGAGGSSYGVFAIGNGTSSLVLNDVSITAASAGAGAAGAAGTVGGGGKGGGCTQTVGGSVGTAPAAGAGTYSVAGFAPVSATAVQAGSGGVGATPASVQTCMENGGPGEPTGCGPVTCGAGSPPNCQPSICTVVSSAVPCAGTTLSGCGGAGGTGGYSGGGGGSSVALFLWNEIATMVGGTLQAGAGGSGGKGGAGASGGAGAAGGPLGAPVNYYTDCASGLHVCTLSGEMTLDSASGSQGGTGNTGGGGAGGTGGDSYAYYLGMGATLTPSGMFLFKEQPAANGGAAGSPNGNLGSDGNSQPTN